MALQKQPIAINFTQGLQTKVDPFQIPIGQFPRLQNVIFSKDGLLQKRNGFRHLVNAPTNAMTLATLNSGLIMLGDTCQSYDYNTNKLTNAGNFQPLSLDTSSIVRRATSQLTCDTAIANNGLAITTWLDSDDSSYYQISDAITGQVIIPAVALPDTSTCPRVFVVGNFFIVTFLATVTVNTHLQYICIPVTNPASPNPAATISTQANGLDAAYDGYVFENVLYLALDCNDVGGAIRVWPFTGPQLSNGTITAPVTVVASAELMSVIVNPTIPAVPVIWVAYTTSTSVKAFALNQNLTVLLAPTTITPGITDGVNQITTSYDESDLVAIYEKQNSYSYTPSVPEASDTKTDYIAYNTLTIAGTPGVETTVLRGVGIASKAVISTELDETVFVATYGQQLQPTYFLINLAGDVLARFAYSNGGGYLTTQIQPQINQDTEGNLKVSYLYADLLQAVNKTQGDSLTGVYAQRGINLLNIDLTTTTQSLEIGNSLNVSGGMLWQYDGVKIREHGFNVFPEDIGVVGDRFQVPGNLSASMGAIFYQVTYEWTDAAGNIHRSAPSIPVSYTVLTPPSSFTANTTNLSATLTTVSSFTNLQVGQGITGTGIPVGTYIIAMNTGAHTITMSANATATNSTVTITPSAVTSTTINIPTLRQTYKTDNVVRIVIYRWSTSQETYYRITSITDPLLNNPLVDSVTYQDSASDASIIGNDILYTAGGVIENICAPGSNAMTLWQSRLFMVDSEDKNLIWYSKQVIEATPIEMSDLLTLYVAPTTGAQGSTGPITALSSMDDKLIIFKKDAIYYITGQGPDNTGAQNQYSDPVFITGTVGSINQRSIVLMPSGIMFQSDKGIWLLGRDLSTNYLGSPVESYTQDFEVTSALCIPGTNQVRFTLDNKTAVMYDYFFNRWSNWVNIPAVSSVVYRDVHTYLNVYGKVVIETPNAYIDISTPVTMGLSTGWINLAGVQGFERFYHGYLLGVYYTPFKLNVSLAYDYNPSPSQNVLVTPNNQTPNWGGEAQWGSGQAWGGPGNKFEARFFPKVQKCESFQISIDEVYDDSQAVTPGLGLTLSGLNLIIGQKRGFRTQSSKRSFG